MYHAASRRRSSRLHDSHSGVRCWHPWLRFGRRAREFDSRTRSVNCFGCNKDLTPVFRDFDDGPESLGATVFRAAGNYGSGAFDPPGAFGDQFRLVINICDDCLLDHKDRVLLQEKAFVEPQHTYTTWDGGDID